MEKVLNGVKYVYVKNVFGSKILGYVDLGNNIWVNSDEYNVEPITSVEAFISKCEEIASLYN